MVLPLTCFSFSNAVSVFSVSSYPRVSWSWRAFSSSLSSILFARPLGAGMRDGGRVVDVVGFFVFSPTLVFLI